MPSISEEQDTFIKTRTRLESSIKKDLAIDIQNLNILEKDESDAVGETDNLLLSTKNTDSNTNIKKYSICSFTRLAPIASSETLKTCSSTSNCSKTNEKLDNLNIQICELNTTTNNNNNTNSNSVVLEKKNSLIENVLNNLAKVNVSDGLFNLKSEQKYNGSILPLGTSLDSKHDTDGSTVASPSFNNINQANLNGNNPPILLNSNGNFTNGVTNGNGNIAYDNENQSNDEDYDTDEDQDLKQDYNNRVKFKNRDDGSCNTSFNGSISSATSSASRLTVSLRENVFNLTFITSE